MDTWSDAHQAAPSRILPLPSDPNLLVTGDDDGVVNLWDQRQKPRSSGDAGGSTAKPVRSYGHHFDWITDFHYSRHLVAPRMSKEEREQKEKQEEARRKRQAKKDRKRKHSGQGKHRSSDSDADSDAEHMSDENSSLPAPGRERLVCTSGDGTLSVLDFRAPLSGKQTKGTSSGSDPTAIQPGVEVSEDQEDELLSITSVRSGSKLLVGTQLGMLSLWAPSRGLLDHVDRIPGHPSSIDCLQPLDDDTILTGSSDGLIRVVQVLPHKFLGVVADHGQGLPVERMKRRGRLLVSCGHGSEIKVTDVGALLEDGDDDDDDEDDQSVGDGDDGRHLDAEQLAKSLGHEDSDGDDDDEEDEEDEGEDDDGEGQAHLREGQNVESADEGGDSDDQSSEPDDDDASDSAAEEVSTIAKPMNERDRRRQATLAAAGETKDQLDNGDFFADL